MFSVSSPPTDFVAYLTEIFGIFFSLLPHSAVAAAAPFLANEWEMLCVVVDDAIVAFTQHQSAARSHSEASEGWEFCHRVSPTTRLSISSMPPPLSTLSTNTLVLLRMINNLSFLRVLLEQKLLPSLRLKRSHRHRTEDSSSWTNLAAGTCGSASVICFPRGQSAINDACVRLVSIAAKSVLTTDWIAWIEGLYVLGVPDSLDAAASRLQGANSDPPPSPPTWTLHLMSPQIMQTVELIYRNLCAVELLHHPLRVSVSNSLGYGLTVTLFQYFLRVLEGMVFSDAKSGRKFVREDAAWLLNDLSLMETLFGDDGVVEVEVAGMNKSLLHSLETGDGLNASSGLSVAESCVRGKEQIKVEIFLLPLEGEAVMAGICVSNFTHSNLNGIFCHPIVILTMRNISNILCAMTVCCLDSWKKWFFQTSVNDSMIFLCI